MSDYTPLNWQDGSTKLNDDNLNHMDQGIASRVGKGELVLNVHDYGATGDGATDDRAAIQAAFDAADATGGHEVLIPAGDYVVNGDLVVSTSGLRVGSNGYGATLRFVDGGLVFDGSTGILRSVSAPRLKVTRTGTAGPAVRVKGGGAGTGVARFHLGLDIIGSTGDGLLIDGSYIGTLHEPMITGCAGEGMIVAYDTPTGSVGAINVSVFGGEIQGNGKAGTFRGATSVNFYGTAIEGNTIGLELAQEVRLCGFFGAYFESNGSYDVKVGTDPAAGYGHTFQNCKFVNGTSGSDHAVIAHRAPNLRISSCTFSGYNDKPVSLDDGAGAREVGGWAESCVVIPSGELVDNQTNSFGKVTPSLYAMGKAMADGARVNGDWITVDVPSDVSKQTRIQYNYSADVNSGDVMWELSYGGDVTSGVTVVTYTVTVPATAGQIAQAVFNRDLTAWAGSRVFVRASRLGGNAPDTCTGTVTLHDFQIDARAAHVTP